MGGDQNLVTMPTYCRKEDSVGLLLRSSLVALSAVEAARLSQSFPELVLADGVTEHTFSIQRKWKRESR